MLKCPIRLYFICGRWGVYFDWPQYVTLKRDRSSTIGFRVGVFELSRRKWRTARALRRSVTTRTRDVQLNACTGKNRARPLSEQLCRRRRRRRRRRGDRVSKALERARRRRRAASVGEPRAGGGDRPSGRRGFYAETRASPSRAPTRFTITTTTPLSCLRLRVLYECTCACAWV